MKTACRSVMAIFLVSLLPGIVAIGQEPEEIEWVEQFNNTSSQVLLSTQDSGSIGSLEGLSQFSKREPEEPWSSEIFLGDQGRWSSYISSFISLTNYGAAPSSSATLECSSEVGNQIKAHFTGGAHISGGDEGEEILGTKWDQHAQITGKVHFGTSNLPWIKTTPQTILSFDVSLSFDPSSNGTVASLGGGLTVSVWFTDEVHGSDSIQQHLYDDELASITTFSRNIYEVFVLEHGYEPGIISSISFDIGFGANVGGGEKWGWRQRPRDAEEDWCVEDAWGEDWCSSDMCLGGVEQIKWCWVPVPYEPSDAEAEFSVALDNIALTGGVKPIEPVASFSYSPELPFAGQQITFDASSSYDPDGEVVRYRWLFDEMSGSPPSGPPIEVEGMIVSSVFSKPGAYYVFLIVWDDDGMSAAAEAPPFLIIEQGTTDCWSYRIEEEVKISCNVMGAAGVIYVAPGSPDMEDELPPSGDYPVSADSVRAEVTKPEGAKETVFLSEVGSGQYEGTFTDTTAIGPYSVNIFAQKEGYISGGSSLSFNVKEQLYVYDEQTDKHIYVPNEPVEITCLVEDETAAAVSDAIVEATITRPEGSVETIFFNEGVPGYYAGIFTNTSEIGYYSVQVCAEKEWYTPSCGLLSFEVSGEHPVADFTYSPESPLVGQVIDFDASLSYDQNGEIMGYIWDLGDGNTAIGKVVDHIYTEADEYTIELTVIDNDGLDGTIQKVITIERCLEIGSINICADRFESQPDGSIKATGSIEIGEYLTVSQDGFVLIDGVSVTGDGAVFLSIPSGPMPLFRGEFSVNITTGEVRENGLAQWLLESIAGFTNPVISSFVANAINGTATFGARLDLKIPGLFADDPEAGALSVKVDVEYTIDYEGNESGAASNFGIFLAGLTFHLENVTLSANSLACEKAKLILPQALGGFGTEIYGISISSSTPYVEFAGGKLALPKIHIGEDKDNPIFEISASVELGRDGYGFYFSGGGKLTICKPKTEIETTISIQSESPYLREASVSIHTSLIGIPVGTTGAFLTGGSGSLKLVPELELAASVDLGFGVHVPGKGYPVVGKPGFRVSPSIFELNGQLSMYEFVELHGSIVYQTTGDFQGSLSAKIDLRVIRVDGNMNIHIWKNPGSRRVHFTGQIIASVTVPQNAICILIPPRDWQLAECKVLFGELRHGNMNVFGFKSSVNILGRDYAVFIDKDGNVAWGTNLDSIVLVDQIETNPAPRKVTHMLQQAGWSEFVPATIGGGTEYAIFATGWEQGDLNVTLTKPDGNQVTPETAGSDHRVMFLSESNAQTYIIDEPQPGEWKMVLDDVDGDEGYQIRVLGAGSGPSIQVVTPSIQNEDGNPDYTVQWNTTDPSGTSTVSLYYDDDHEGTDGILVVRDLDSADQSYQWDTTFVPTGEYYVYALIDDTRNFPGISYSSGTVQVINNSPPATPVGLSVTPGNAALMAHWQSNSELDLANYNVYYRLESETDWLVANPGQANTYRLPNLINGRNYVVALSASDTSGNESPMTAEVIVSPSADADTLPPMPPTDLVAQVVDETVAVSWVASLDTDVVSYNLHYGYTAFPPYLGSDAQEGGSPINVGDVTNFQLSGLTPGMRYYLALTAKDAMDNESELSQVAWVDFTTETDSDGDGLRDDWEIAHLGNLDALNAANGDYDLDGLSNIGEQEANTSPVRPDTDADRVLDGIDPHPNAKLDADGDFMSDDWETIHNVTDADVDEEGDGLANLGEYIWNTNPNLADTDGDGATDFEEIQARTDPNDPGSVPGQSGDSTPPIVFYHHPDGDQALTDSVIYAIFNEPMDAQTLTLQTIEVLVGSEVITGQTTYEANANCFVFTPDEPLIPGMQVSVTVKHVAADLVGNTLDGNADGTAADDSNDDYQWTFTTKVEIADVTSVSHIDKFSTRYDRRAEQFSMMATWTNIGTYTFSEPLHLVIENITSPAVTVVTVANADGETEDGKPYFDYSDLVGDTKLGPGETSEAKMLIFDNPTRARFEFDISCWAVVEDGDGVGAPSKQQPKRIHIVIPGETTLAQNYPNPFNPETWIPYELADSGDIKILIYDVQGRLVRTIDLGHREIGQYFGRDEAAYWDGRNEVGEETASGIYFYQIQAGDFQSVRKMVILR